MRSCYERTYVGGGQYAPSGEEQDAYEQFVDVRVAELLEEGVQIFEAEERAEETAYSKFGFSREHFA